MTQTVEGTDEPQPPQPYSAAARGGGGGADGGGGGGGGGGRRRTAGGGGRRTGGGGGGRRRGGRRRRRGEAAGRATTAEAGTAAADGDGDAAAAAADDGRRRPGDDGGRRRRAADGGRRVGRPRRFRELARSRGAPGCYPRRERCRGSRHVANVGSRCAGPASSSATSGPLSVLKLSLIFYFCVWLIVFFGLMIAFVHREQTWGWSTRPPSSGASSSSERGANFKIERLDLRPPVPDGVMMVVVAAILNLIVTFLYNLISDVVGGIEVTLSEKRLSGFDTLSGPVATLRRGPAAGPAGACSSARLERFPDKDEVDGSSPSRPTPARRRRRWRRQETEEKKKSGFFRQADEDRVHRGDRRGGRPFFKRRRGKDLDEDEWQELPPPAGG